MYILFLPLPSPSLLGYLEFWGLSIVHVCICIYFTQNEVGLKNFLKNPKGSIITAQKH